MEILNASLVDWSRAQFAMTAMYHWLFVPLTLGLGVIMAIAESLYVKTGNKDWKSTAKFWQKIFGINFAIGVATGLILEFQFGTNWSNYSWFVGDIFGAPLAIEGILAFFMEATFISIMFFGWKRVSKGMHLAATWLTIIGATLSAVWILIANSWMQFPVGMEFNPDNARNEMVDFAAVVFSPVAINKFFHTVLSCWILGSVFVMGIASWHMLKKKNLVFARQSMKLAAIVGLVGAILTATTGHTSSQVVAEKQPMKLAVMEGLYEGSSGQGLVVIGWPNLDKKYNDSQDAFAFKIELPSMLSFLSFGDANAFVPGVKDIIDGGYVDHTNKTTLSFNEKQKRGKAAITALASYRKAKEEGNETAATAFKKELDANYEYFGYGYLNSAEELIPSMQGLLFWSYRIMVGSGFFFILLFVVVLFMMRSNKIEKSKWLLWVSILSVPLVYVASQAGWIVTEVGRQPWAIQDVLPLKAAISSLSATSVKTTFFLFLALFTILLIAEVSIMLKQIKKGPNESDLED